MSDDKQQLPTEQTRPKDVTPQVDEDVADTEAPVAPPFVAPVGKADEAERPIVNPVTGGAL